jgi:hypothetical protein
MNGIWKIKMLKINSIEWILRSQKRREKILLKSKGSSDIFEILKIKNKRL